MDADVTTGVITEDAYIKLRPVCIMALAKLAKRGFTVDPAESLDLVHDFFLSEWGKVNEHYRRDKGAFEGYVYGAFVHYARPRLVRRRKLQHLMVDFELVTPGQEIHAGQEDWPYEGDQLDKRPEIKKALKSLHPLQRELVFRYFVRSIPSEREMARRLGLSRYGLRESLLEALGRVTVLVNKPKGIPEKDWDIAVAVWREERTVEQTAKYLRVTPTQVRKAQERNRRFIAEALRHYTTAKAGAKRSVAMKAQQHLTPSDLLLEQLLKSPGNQELLNQVRERPEEVLAAMENLRSFGLTDDEMRDLDTAWLAAVYQTVAESLGYTEPEASNLSKSLFEARAGEEKAIGVAFKEALLPSLPPSLLQDLIRALQETRELDPEVQREVEEEPSVRSSWPESKPLAHYGVTPLGIYLATEATSSLLVRLVDYEELRPDATVFLGLDRVGTLDDSCKDLNLCLILDEIANVTEWPDETGQAVWQWLVRSAQYVPLLFDGFYADPREGGVELTPTDEHQEDLLMRWDGTSVAVAAG